MRLIDADALEKEGWSLHRTVRVDRHTSEYQVKQIAKVPTVEPESKTGKWIEDTEQNHIEKCWYCSECGYKAWGQYEKTDFCGGCGAKMDGGEEE